MSQQSGDEIRDGRVYNGHRDGCTCLDGQFCSQSWDRYQESEREPKKATEINVEEVASLLRDLFADYYATLRDNHGLAKRPGRFYGEDMPLIQRARALLAKIEGR